MDIYLPGLTLAKLPVLVRLPAFERGQVPVEHFTPFLVMELHSTTLVTAAPFDLLERIVRLGDTRNFVFAIARWMIRHRDQRPLQLEFGPELIEASKWPKALGELAREFPLH